MFELTLPYPNYFPTKPSQPAIYRQVSFPVPLNLDPPESPVLLGQPKTPGTAVPKATIYKYRQFLLSKGKVRLTQNWQMPPPAPYVPSPHQSGQPYLGLLIPLAQYLGHNL